MKQPEALRLAEITQFKVYPRHPDHDDHVAAELRRLHGEIESMRAERISNEKELRRLHEVNQELFEAIKRLVVTDDAHTTIHAPDGDDIARMIEYAKAFDNARAALAKAGDQA